MRRLEAHEIQILRHPKSGVVFTPEELADLVNGTASFKVYGKAGQVLEKHRKFMMMPFSREEALNTFLTGRQFTAVHGGLNNKVVFLTRALMEKGLVTQEDLDAAMRLSLAETWHHICDHCAKSGADHAGQPVTAGERLPGLPEPLCDKVVECPVFEERKKAPDETKGANGETKGVPRELG